MDVSKELIRSIVEKVLAESAGTAAVAEPYKEKDPSGIIKITTDKVETERFEQDGVYLKDVVTLEEAPRMGAGLMELKDGTSFEWTLTYDEYDCVVEGTLEIEINGNVLTAKPGEIIYIPKGSHIHFQTPNYANTGILYIRQTGLSYKEKAYERLSHRSYCKKITGESVGDLSGSQNFK